MAAWISKLGSPGRMLVRALVLACLCCSAGSATVSAQDGSDAARAASARMMFEQGVELAERGDWVSAEDRFRRALALRVSPVIAYNLASALSEQGKLIEASETVRRVLSDDNAEPELRKSAMQLSEGLAQRIGRILIQVHGQQLGDSVVLDGNVLHAAQINVEIPADPGSHQLRLERAGKTIDVRSFTLAPGGREALLLTAPALAPAAQVAAHTSPRSASETSPVGSAQPARSEQGSLLGRWWFWAGAAAVVAAGTVIGVAAASGISHAEAPFQGNLGAGSVQVEVAP